MDWTPHEATKARSLLSTVFWSQKERAPSSPVQGYHQEKHEAESISQVIEAVFVASRPTADITDSMMTMILNSGQFCWFKFRNICKFVLEVD